MAKIKRGKASITVIFPCWQTELWFPQFQRMVEHATALLKAHHKLLQLPGTGQKHPSWKKLQLIVAHFSGISKWKDYLQMSVKSSWHHGDQVRTESIIEQCRDGWNIAEDGGYHTQHPPVSEVLDFLHALFGQGLGYSGINRLK